MTVGPLAGQRVAIVVDDDAAVNLDAALSLGAHLREAHGAIPELWTGEGGGAPARCHSDGTPWRAVPRPCMDGLFRSWIFVRQLGERLRDRRPAYVVAVGPHAGAGCGLLWRTSEVRGYVWLQVDDRVSGLDRRALRLAGAWTPRFVPATPTARRALRSTLTGEGGRSLEERIERPLARVVSRSASLDWSPLVAGLLAGADTAAGAAPVVVFDRDLVYRSVFPSFAALHDEAMCLVRQVRAAGLRRVVIVGDGLPARVLVDACRERSIRVSAMVPPGRFRQSGPLDGVPRVPLAAALSGGARHFVLTDCIDTRRMARRIRRQARDRVPSGGLVILGVHPTRRWSGLRPAGDVIKEETLERASGLIASVRRSRVRAVNIYGASEVGRALLRLARRSRLEVAAFVDGNRALWGDVVDGVEVIPLSYAVEGGTHAYAVGSFDSVPAIRQALADAYRRHPADPQVFSL